ncbi:tetraacyldisaccharide 4'-kinase [Rubripirellula reticaptiva]|uniref:Tetraacyldisaccharide 4'-kinase n=1 Tax=Rubripirellula reticaptiva TaxID=2528013 RepID=A0A5C6F396_9BACT|nr:tetraacyldisaccharide 4'-kinase [Rubripirellula reticaptiva]TWU55054.1 Tetraacyldisaccharide 4'-kinase [Rubripirellula reticaptiva]
MKWDYRSIISGTRRDPVAIAIRGALWVASMPYGVVVASKNRRFESGKLEIHRVGTPVISVGNLTTGGTGKTPIVCYLAKWFRSHSTRVMIVSRGYGRGDSDTNDEAKELHDRLPDVPHVQNPDRVEAARVAIEELEAELILMDDGFQHRRLHRDLDIVVIDATCPFGFGHKLPRGLLREPVSSLRRADLAIITRCDAVPEDRLRQIETTLRKTNADLPFFRSRHVPSGIREYPSTTHATETLAGQNVAVISAIGNPMAFEKTVASCGAKVIAANHLGDHDPYAPQTVTQLRAWIRSLGDSVDRVVCTHKDLVKLQTDQLGGKPIVAIMIDLEIDGDLSPWLSRVKESAVRNKDTQ